MEKRRRTDSIHPQTVQLGCERTQSSHQSHDAVLGGRVCEQAWGLFESGDRRDECDAFRRRDVLGRGGLLVESVLFFQVRDGQAGEVQCAVEIDVDHIGDAGWCLPSSALSVQNKMLG